MKIAVTGANGYLGQGIVNKLLNDGNEVVAVDFNADHIDERAKYVNCDIFHTETPYEELGEPDVLLHLAWRDGFVHNSDAHIEDLYFHYGFIKRMIESGIEQVAIMGSMHEVGFFEGSINESTPCHPQTLYGIAKNTLRDIVQELADKNNTVFQWLRGYYIVGNSKFGSSIFSKITQAVENEQKEFPFTMGQNQYDFLDYSDFCYRVAVTVEQKEINGIINISSGRPEKLADRVERFITENHYDIKLNYGVFPDRPYDSKAIWGDSSKIDAILTANEGK